MILIYKSEVIFIEHLLPVVLGDESQAASNNYPRLRHVTGCGFSGACVLRAIGELVTLAGWMSRETEAEWV